MIDREDFWVNITYCFECPLCMEISESSDDNRYDDTVLCEHCGQEIKVGSN
jgi:transcription elongation factor Elf1